MTAPRRRLCRAPKTPTAKAARASSTSGRPRRSPPCSEPGGRKPSAKSTMSPPRAISRAATSCTSPRPVETAARCWRQESAALEAELAEDRRTLLAARARRVRPAPRRQGPAELERPDDRCPGPGRRRAGRAPLRPRPRPGPPTSSLGSLRDAARPPGPLLARRPARPSAFLDDYASLANALATLHEQQPAAALARRGRCGWPTSCWRISPIPGKAASSTRPTTQEPLIVRKKDLVDNSVPSGNGLAVTVLLRLADLCGRDDYRQAADEHSPRLHGHPGAGPRRPPAELLLGLEMAVRPPSPPSPPAAAGGT